MPGEGSRVVSSSSPLTMFRKFRLTPKTGGLKYHFTVTVHSLTLGSSVKVSWRQHRMLIETAQSSRAHLNLCSAR